MLTALLQPPPSLATFSILYVTNIPGNACMYLPYLADRSMHVWYLAHLEYPADWHIWQTASAHAPIWQLAASADWRKSIFIYAQAKRPLAPTKLPCHSQVHEHPAPTPRLPSPRYPHMATPPSEHQEMQARTFDSGTILGAGPTLSLHPFPESLM